jgi:hypothetical protein
MLSQTNGETLAKILILDIETSPNIAYVWRFWKENVGAKQVLDHSTIMSFAYKWLGEKETYYFDTQFHKEEEILPFLIEVLDAADIVVAHNGNKFDLPTIQGRAMVAGIRPPSPYKTIDTLLVARYEFNFPSNSLEYLSGILDVEEKDSHKEFPGFELWSECLKGNPKAWDEMRKYNIQDVDTLEQVYLKMRPWMKRHPNVAVFEGKEETLCTRCGSSHIQWRGYSYTNFSKFRRFQCQDCGGWGRTRYNEADTAVRRVLAAPAI